jgi:pyridoxal phosphate enzyme (YggS family)
MSAQTVSERLAAVRGRITAACERGGRSADEVTLIAVTKGVAPPAIREAVEAGVTDLGENRVQEAQGKRGELAGLSGVTWHMIGHLQTNKVGLALTLFDIIHSVDSLHLAEAVSKRAERTIPAFLEVNVASEATKYGFTMDELAQQYTVISRLPNLDIRGLMTVAPLATDAEDARPVFRRLREAASALGLSELSMGMTDDFEMAIEEGATHVRIGRAIFGERG